MAANWNGGYMPNELVKIGTRSITLDVPDSATAAVFRALRPIVINTIREAAGTLGEITRAVVTVIDENQLQIEYFKQAHKVYRRDVIPIVARTEVHQHARDQIRSMDLDEDLRSAALEDLNRKLQERRSR